jgi:hypothetical protein
MVVRVWIPVEAAVSAAEVEFHNFAHVPEEFQIPVYRAQADVGDAFAHLLINPIGRGVRSGAAENLQNHPPLPGGSAFWLVLFFLLYNHGTHLEYNKSY